jgi:hypothetical protein
MDVAATIVAATSLLAVILRFALMWKLVSSSAVTGVRRMVIKSMTPLSINLSIESEQDLGERQEARDLGRRGSGRNFKEARDVPNTHGDDVTHLQQDSNEEDSHDPHLHGA